MLVVIFYYFIILVRAFCLFLAHGGFRIWDGQMIYLYLLMPNSTYHSF